MINLQIPSLPRKFLSAGGVSPLTYGGDVQTGKDVQDNVTLQERSEIGCGHNKRCKFVL